MTEKSITPTFYDNITAQQAKIQFYFQFHG